MKAKDFWRNVGSGVKYYTSSTSSDIPPTPGIYSWLLPVHLFSEDLNGLIELVSLYQGYSTRHNPSLSSLKGEAEFKEPWAVFRLQGELARLGRHHENSFNQDLWSKLLEDADSRQKVKALLMHFSLFLPPLYVGKANDLSRRYHDHVSGRNSGFHTRFQDFQNLNDGPKLDVRDLVFSCIRIPTNLFPETEEGARFFEKILQHLAKPRFSEK